MSESEHLKTLTIHLAADHAGFHHKEAVRDWLLAEGVACIDHGALILDEEDDFPDYIAPAVAAVADSPATTRGLIFGGSGQGEAMLANRYRGVRATVYYGGPDDIVMLSRSHNDANVLSIGARFVSVDEVKRLVWLWLTTECVLGDKYVRRNQKIDTMSQIQTA
jgi:ribose 5-phosphate isomerase B